LSSPAWPFGVCGVKVPTKLPIKLFEVTEKIRQLAHWLHRARKMAPCHRASDGPRGPGRPALTMAICAIVVAALLRLARACQWATAHQMRCRVSVQTSRAFESESTRSPRTEALAIDWSDIAAEWKGNSVSAETLSIHY
jgi:hypothetical protein